MKSVYISQEPLLATAYDSEEEKNRQRKQIAASMCCGFGIVLFLLLFFLIPRRPFAHFNSSTVYFNPYRVVQSYTVYNYNMYSLSLSDFDMTLSAETAQGTFQSVNGTLLGDSDTFTVPRNSKKDMSLVYYWDSSSEQLQAVRSQCATSQGVVYTTSGTMNMATPVTNFHDVSVGPWETIFFCT